MEGWSVGGKVLWSILSIGVWGFVVVVHSSGASTLSRKSYDLMFY